MDAQAAGRLPAHPTIAPMSIYQRKPRCSFLLLSLIPPSLSSSHRDMTHTSYWSSFYMPAPGMGPCTPSGARLPSMRRFASCFSAVVGLCLRMSGTWGGRFGLWPIDMPTRTWALVSSYSPQHKAAPTYQRLQRRVGVVNQIIVVSHLSRLKQEQQRAAPKLEVSQLVGSLDLIALLACNHGAAHHHGTDANYHDATVRCRVNGADDADVLAIHIECGTDSHWVDGVVLALNQLWLVQDTVYGDMEAMIVLRRKSEDAQRAAVVPLCVCRVRLTQQPFDCELAPLDPNGLRRVDRVEDYGPAIGWRHNDPGVLWRRTWARIGLEGSVEEFVEALKLVRRHQHLSHVELVEGNKRRDLCRGSRIVVLLALLEAEGFEQFAD